MSATETPLPSARRIPRIAPARKERASQLPYALVLLAVAAVIAYELVVRRESPVSGFVWIVGIALGLAMQRSRFCFTAAMRDPLLTGSTSLTKAVIVGLAVATAGFAAAQFGAFSKAGQLADAMKLSSLDPVGLHTVVGGVLFGIGAVIAGGCATGTLMRVGEGFVQQWLVLPFFVVGSAAGAASYPLWKAALFVDPKRVVYLPKALGGFGLALTLQFGLLLAAWLAADWWGKRKATIH
jgi:uncharacterized membrane protein YedE/YeeE